MTEQQIDSTRKEFGEVKDEPKTEIDRLKHDIRANFRWMLVAMVIATIFIIGAIKYT